MESYLSVGLLHSDRLLSEGRARRAPSDAFHRLVDAARSAGVPEDAAVRTARAVLLHELRELWGAAFPG